MSDKTLDDYKVIRTVGQGAWGKVKLVQSLDGSYLAAKIVKHLEDRPAQALDQYFFNELRTSQRVVHPNILKIYASNHDGLYTSIRGSRKVAYILMEFCANGNLFDLVGEFHYIPEPTSRYYFSKILSAIECCHREGFCHRDIKPENILINSQNEPILGDLGFSCSTLGKNHDYLLRTPVGTLYTQAPEIQLKLAYKGEQIDIFALGVTLFSMMTGCMPFRTAHVSDALFKLFCQNKAYYWKAMNKHIPDDILTPSFINLINGMLDANPETRWTIDQIKASEWFNLPYSGPIQKVVGQRQVQRVANQAKRTQIKGYRDEVGEVVVSIFNEDFIIPCITANEYDSLRYSKLITTLEPNHLINAIQVLFRKYDVNFPPYNEDLKIKFEREEIEIRFKFYKFDGILALFLLKTQGNEFEFREVFEDLLEIVNVIEEEVSNQ